MAEGASPKGSRRMIGRPMRSSARPRSAIIQGWRRGAAGPSGQCRLRQHRRQGPTPTVVQGNIIPLRPRAGSYTKGRTRRQSRDG
eukprot:8876127-Prorocentrum_lima.AAC.1